MSYKSAAMEWIISSQVFIWENFKSAFHWGFAWPYRGTVQIITQLWKKLVFELLPSQYEAMKLTTISQIDKLIYHCQSVCQAWVIQAKIRVNLVSISTLNVPWGNNCGLEKTIGWPRNREGLANTPSVRI